MNKGYHVVGIIGSRNYPEDSKPYIKKIINQFDPVSFFLIISGGAKGVDTWAIEYAKERGFKTKEYPPDFDKYGRPDAYHKRNTDIVKDSDEIVAFWDEKSPGTRSVIKKAVKYGKLIAVFNPKGQLVFTNMKEGESD